jgi:hypothetical protein
MDETYSESKVGRGHPNHEVRAWPFPSEMKADFAFSAQSRIMETMESGRGWDRPGDSLHCRTDKAESRSFLGHSVTSEFGANLKINFRSPF